MGFVLQTGQEVPDIPVSGYLQLLEKSAGGAKYSAVQFSRRNIHFMRIDKLTTKFQEALSDAQSLALGNDNAYIEPIHVLTAMLRQPDGPKSLLARSGANVTAMTTAAENAIKRLGTNGAVIQNRARCQAWQWTTMDAMDTYR